MAVTTTAALSSRTVPERNAFIRLLRNQKVKGKCIRENYIVFQNTVAKRPMDPIHFKLVWHVHVFTCARMWDVPFDPFTLDAHALS